MNFDNSGFTLIEILVFIAVIGLLSIAILVAIDPLEQINRGNDNNLLQISTDLYKSTDRLIATEKPAPWNNPLNTVALSSDQGQSILSTITITGELTANYADTNYQSLSNIFLSTSENYSKRAFCFLPKSYAFKQHELTKYSATGDLVEGTCPEEGCYLCISTETEDQNQENDSNSIAEMSEEELCANFNPEYPHYAFTEVQTDVYANHGCTHFIVYDEGCESNYCPTGQRALRKHYSGPPAHISPRDWTSCVQSRSETEEIYCVSEPYARCDINRSGRATNPLSFEWGCTNPRRPMRWDESRLP